jgi:hypothetical protein
MTAETAPGQAWATPGGPAEPRPTRLPSLPQRMVRYGIWLAVGVRILGDRRFQATVITSALGAYALASLIKNNQARPVRRTADWYKRIGDSKELQRAGRALEPGKR